MIKHALAFLLIGAVMLRPSYGAGDGMPSWQKCFFDGKEFREGTASSGASVYWREGYLPVIQTRDEALREDRLPPGTGGVVVLCYIQIAGGKLQSHGGYVPLVGAVIEISNGERMMAIRSDGEGYSVLALPAGEYEMRVQGFTRKVRVEKDKTTFLRVRAGKRMVD